MAPPKTLDPLILGVLEQGEATLYSIALQLDVHESNVRNAVTRMFNQGVLHVKVEPRGSQSLRKVYYV